MEVAKDLGTTRTGPQGRALYDVNYDPIAIECKAQGKLSLRKDDLAQAKRNAGVKPWALLLKEKQTGVKLAVIDYELFLEYLKWLKERDNV